MKSLTLEPGNTVLRPYQDLAVNGIRAEYAKGVKKTLLHLATGGGKTVIFCHILKSLYEKGKTGLMVVHGRQLVDQGAARLAREGVPHGVIMAGRKAKMGQQIYVCSIDTLRARKLRPPADLIVIDEAHMACSESYKEFLEDYPDSYVLGVTATPYVTESMRHLADVVVRPVGIQGLIDDGFLVPARYVIPVKMDLKDIRTSGGDYTIQDLAELYGRSQVIGDIAHNWGKFAKGRPTIAFAPRVDNSRAIVDMMLGLGIRAAHCDADTREPERKRLMAELEVGSIDVLSNVGILCTGVDLPRVSCILMARPTKSLNLYIQQAGRGTRPAPGKSDFLILDHADNIRRHGFITDEHEVLLDGTPASTKEPGVKTCPECYAGLHISAMVCTECGYVFETIEKTGPDLVAGDLQEITPENSIDLKIKSRISELKRVRKAKGYKYGWMVHVIRAEFGEEAVTEYFPKREVPHWVQRTIG